MAIELNDWGNEDTVQARPTLKLDGDVVLYHGQDGNVTIEETGDSENETFLDTGENPTTVIGMVSNPGRISFPAPSKPSFLGYVLDSIRANKKFKAEFVDPQTGRNCTMENAKFMPPKNFNLGTTGANTITMTGSRVEIV